MINQVLSEWDEEHSPSLFTVFLGANDASIPETNREQYVPLDEYGGNVQALIERIRERFPLAAVIVITPPPLDESQWTSGTRLSDVTRRYAERCVEAARACGAACIDLHSAILAKQQPLSLFLKDGLHLSAAGNGVVFEEVTSTIEKNFPALSPAGLPWHYPYWKDVNFEKPEEALVAPSSAL